MHVGQRDLTAASRPGNGPRAGLARDSAPHTPGTTAANVPLLDRLDHPGWWAGESGSAGRVPVVLLALSFRLAGATGAITVFAVERLVGWSCCWSWDTACASRRPSFKAL